MIKNYISVMFHVYFLQNSTWMRKYTMVLFMYSINEIYLPLKDEILLEMTHFWLKRSFASWHKQSLTTVFGYNRYYGLKIFKHATW